MKTSVQKRLHSAVYLRGPEPRDSREREETLYPVHPDLLNSSHQQMANF